MSPNGNKIKNAMILAAGLGTRLRPLTFKTPKPLLPVGAMPLIDHALILLKNVGIKNVVINLHHLGGQIRAYVGSGRRHGLKVRYTFEKNILGTGGGIKNAEKYLKDGPFLVINGDVLIDIDLKGVILAYLKERPAALMVVRRLKKGEAYAKLDISKGLLKGFGAGKFMFTGVQVFDPIIFKFLKRPSCLIGSGYKKLLEKGLNVAVIEHKGRWNDIGTIERYVESLLVGSFELSC